MATNQWNTIIKQVKGASLQIEFTNSPSRPFGVVLPTGQRYAFKTQTVARKFVMDYEKQINSNR